MIRKKSLLALLLSLCMVVGILPATVFAAGAGMPQNIRWAESPKSMVQWDAPSGGGQYQYELRLKLGETIIDGPDLTVQRYHLFNGSLMTEARENYTVEIRARSCIIVGEFPNEYVTSPGEWGDWATLEGSGGGEGPTPPHEHSYGDWQKDETQHWKECRCGEKTEVGNHTFGDWTITKEPTTTETGSRERTCSICKYKQEETIPVHEHSYGDWQKDETQHWKECSCGDKTEVGNHTFGDWTITKEPTTTETGSRERTCSICKYTQEETIPVHEHSYGDWQKDETQHWKECSCGDKTEVGNHTFDDWTITKEPTTTETGSRERTCSICKYKQEETIPVHEHSYGDWQKDETQHWKECSCGDKTEVGNHTFDDWTITKEPTTTETGSRERTCSICKYKQEETIPVHEHSYGDWQKDETQHWKECRCGDKTEVGNHTFDDWTITKEPTTTETGSRERTCSICKYKQEETIPVHEHSYGDWQKDETQHWKECSCGDKTEVGNHTFDDWTITKEPTTTETGSRERTCSICKYKQEETIPVHEHSYGDWQKDETQHWKECSCGDKTEVGNHTFDDWTITKEPTTTETVPENVPAPSANISRKRRFRFMSTATATGRRMKPSTGRNAPAAIKLKWATILSMIGR